MDEYFIRGTEGSDDLIGSDGDNTIWGYEGDDRVIGDGPSGTGRDIISLGGGDDYACGDNPHDPVISPGGADDVYGEAGNDTIEGYGGADVLRGGIGDDTLRGDDGADTLSGGFNADALIGGAGRDVFLTHKFHFVGTDSVLDFGAGDLAFVMQGGGGKLDLADTAEGALLRWSSRDLMLFEGVSAGDLVLDDRGVNAAVTFG